MLTAQRIILVDQGHASWLMGVRYRAVDDLETRTHSWGKRQKFAGRMHIRKICPRAHLHRYLKLTVMT